VAVLTTIATNVAELSSLSAAWSELAETAGQPYARAEWMLSWWKHAAPPSVDLAVVASHAGPELIGIAPFFATRERPRVYRLLTSPVCAGVVPLARPGAEEEVAASTCAALASLPGPPGMVVLNRLAEGSEWPRMLAAAWPGKRPHLHREEDMSAPVLSLEGRTSEEWLPSLPSSKLRAQIRRAQRALAAKEAEIGLVGPERMAEEIETFIALHLRRMGGSAESEVVGPGVAEWLSEAGAAMADDGALRLWTIRVDDRTISAQLFVAAGGQVAFWLGAFDDDWARTSPGLVALMAAIEDAIDRGDRRLNLGPGMHDYKQRLSDGREQLFTWTLCPRGPDYARARATLGLARGRRAVAHALPESALERYRRLRSRRG
jgi:CelD/BcsL family acetyltransferase involved in cellulose biosynthesis